MRRGLVLVGLLGLVLVLPAVAAAHRRATGAESRAMIYGASGRYYGGTPVAVSTAVPLRCFKTDIATVVKGSQWGAYAFSSYAERPSHQRQCRTGNGVVVAHKIGRRWFVYWEGSDGYPPTRDTNEGTFTLRAVPRRIAKDLFAGLR